MKKINELNNEYKSLKENMNVLKNENKTLKGK